MRRSRLDTPRRRGTDALSTFLEYLGEIDQAVLAREPSRLTSLLRKRTATHMPREVREELLAFSRSPRSGLRAPVQFLRFQHRMAELARGGEKMPVAQHELGLDDLALYEALAPAGAARRRAEDRRAAASPADPHDESTTDSPSRRDL